MRFLYEHNKDIDCYANVTLVCFMSLTSSRFRVVNVGNLSALCRRDKTVIKDVECMLLENRIGVVKLFTSVVLL